MLTDDKTLDKMTCPDCNDDKTKTVHGEIVCATCGLVLEQEFDHEDFEQENFADNNIPGGMPIQPKNISLGYIYSRDEKQYLDGKKDIELMASYLTLPKPIEMEALQLWKHCIDRNVCEGRNYEKVVASCVYLATIVHEQHVPSEKFEPFATNIESTAEIVSTILTLNIILPNSTKAKIVEYAKKLQYPDQLTEEALSIYKSNSKLFKNRRIESTALGILYYVNKNNNLNLTLINICRLGDIVPRSVKSVHKLLEVQYYDKN